ncbi:MAG: hypothetical protein Fur0037_20460 [Planctomycetota bacterium]
MTTPGFRKGRPGGAPAAAAEGFLSISLFSQAQILHLMKTEFARARRYGLPLSCALMAVDRLQQLVDLHGQALREAVRKGLADLVRAKTRSPDLMGVLSDDRYLLLLPHTPLSAARSIAERLRLQFGELEIRVDDRLMALTLSLGITSNHDRETMFFDSMVGQAEAALEHAIARGGNQVRSFDEARLSAGGLLPDSEPQV